MRNQTAKGPWKSSIKKQSTTCKRSKGALSSGTGEASVVPQLSSLKDWAGSWPLAGRHSGCGRVRCTVCREIAQGPRQGSERLTAFLVSLLSLDISERPQELSAEPTRLEQALASLPPHHLPMSSFRVSCQEAATCPSSVLPSAHSTLDRHGGNPRREEA